MINETDKDDTIQYRAPSMIPHIPAIASSRRLGFGVCIFCEEEVPYSDTWLSIADCPKRKDELNHI